MSNNVENGSYLYQYLTVFSVVLGLVSYGLNVGWTSPFLPYLTSNDSTIPMTNEEGSLLAIFYLAGCPIGAIMAGVVADKIGRKWSVLCMAPVVFVCEIIIAFNTSIWCLNLMRFIIGIMDGAGFTIIPMYIGEISSPEIRGLLTSLPSVSFIVGTVIINVIGSFWSIKTCALISALIPALHFIIFAFMPESPYWLLKVGKIESAERSLRKFRGSLDVSQQFRIMKKAVEDDKLMSKSKFLDLFTIPSNRKACIICLLIVIQQRATAKAPLTYYTLTIFQQTGSTLSSNLSTIIFVSVELIAIVISVYFILDRFGKKNLTVISVIGTLISLFSIGLYFILKDVNSYILPYLNWLPIASLVMYNIFFSIGVSFAPFCYASELFPVSVRANAATMVELLMVVSGMITAKVFQALGDYFGTLSVPFMASAIFTLFCLIFIVKMVPDTEKKTLEEIQLLLKGNKVTTTELNKL